MIAPASSSPRGPELLGEDAAAQPTAPHTLKGWRAWGNKLLRTWLALQVSHSGCKYSIERLLVLEEYTKKTSLARVLFVCIATPLPMIAFVLLQECLPLEDPSAGWRASYGFWIRAALLGGVVGHGTIIQATYLIDGAVISTRQLAVLFVFVSLTYVSACIAVAAYVVFPIPFLIVTGNSVFFMLLLLGFRLIVGKRVFKEMMSHQDQVVRYVRVIGAQVLMTLVYPSFQGFFDMSSGNIHYELPVMMCLPILKIIMKNIVSRSARLMEDMIPVAVIFTIDFFNALYLATCMQSASSIVTVMAIMVVDFSQTAMTLYTLHKHTVSILARVKETIGATNTRNSLLSGVCSLCQHPEVFASQVRVGVRLRSSLPPLLSAEGVRTLERLVKTPAPKRSVSYGPSGVLGTTHTPSLKVRSRLRLRGIRSLRIVSNSQRSAIVRPHEDLNASLQTIKHSTARYTFLHPPGKHSGILRETLSAVFTSECLVLTEYLETVIPFLYACYTLVMVSLPSARYHVEMDGITSDNVLGTVSTVLVYAMLELLSFVVLAMVMRRNCGMQSLYQLAFVLETHFRHVQSNMLLWMAVTMTFRVAHFGEFSDHSVEVPRCDCCAPVVRSP